MIRSRDKPTAAAKGGAGTGVVVAPPAAPAASPQTLAGLDAETAARLVAATSDVALVIDAHGVITDVAFGSDELAREGYAKWLGQAWIDTVTPESRPKIQEILRAAVANVPTRSRHVNHPSPRGADVPVLYSAVQVGGDQRVVAIGRDLRAMSSMQQRLVEAQQAMERDYWRLRQAETRYRLLFQTATEAILIVDASSERIVEANPAAGQLLGETANGMIGRTFHELFDDGSRDALLSLLARVRSAGRADDVVLRLAERRREFMVTATLYRQERSAFLLIRFRAPEGLAGAAALPRGGARLLELVEHSPDAFVVTDPQARIVSANPAFVELAQLVSEEQARGESLDRWLGRPGVDLEVLTANLRQHGAVRLFATTLHGDYGASADVEISAVAITAGETPGFGFAIRNVGRRLSAAVDAAQTLPRSVQQLTELVGRVPLKDIVRDTTDLIERLCIEAALELTSDNRASAAEMLGLSRQSLYVKLHRYGLGALGSDAER